MESNTCCGQYNEYHDSSADRNGKPIIVIHDVNSNSDSPADGKAVREDLVIEFSPSTVICEYSRNKYINDNKEKWEAENKEKWDAFYVKYLVTDESGKLKCDTGEKVTRTVARNGKGSKEEMPTLIAMAIDACNVKFPENFKATVDCNESRKQEGLVWRSNEEMEIMAELGELNDGETPWLGRKRVYNNNGKQTGWKVSHESSFWVSMSICKSVIKRYFGSNIENRQLLIDTLSKGKKFTVASFIYFIGTNKFDWLNTDDKEREAAFEHTNREMELIAQGKESVPEWLDKNEKHTQVVSVDYDDELDMYDDNIKRGNSIVERTTNSLLSNQ